MYIKNGIRYLEEDDFYPGKHEHCEETSVETKSGKFTFHPEISVGLRAAKEFCERKGEILAPIATKEDLDQLRSYAGGCTNLGGLRS